MAIRKDNIANVLLRGRTVHAAIAAHPEQFPHPPIPLAAVGTQIGTLEAAQLLVSRGVPSTTAARDGARDVLLSSLEMYRAYVQVTADASADPMLVIERAGMKVAAARVPSKPVLDVRREAPGAVALRANAKLLHKGKTGRCFNWQYTLDGGKTWISVPTTPAARTSIAGLPSLTTCGFRVSVTHMRGQTEWSQMVTVVVH